MVRNLIRNGGFERGDISFWTGYDAKIFTVSIYHPYKGTYCGLVIADGVHEPYIMSNDYIELSLGEIAYFECYLRSVDMFSVGIEAVYYDENLDEIETIVYERLNPGTSNYEQALVAISGIDGAKYVRPKIHMLDDTNDRYLKIDNVLMYKFKPGNVMASEIVMMNEVNITGAGNKHGKWVLVPAFKEAEFILWVDACAGTDETVDVSIESRFSRDNHDIDHSIATFNQITSPAQHQVLVVTAGLGMKIKALAAVGGSPTDVDILVVGRFKR